MILIVDFGGQTAHLIGRRLRQLGVTTEYAYPDETIAKMEQLKPSGIILSGGPASVYAPGAPLLTKEIFSFNIPLFGICYGWQLMAKLLGAEVKNTRKEYGPETLELKKLTSIFKLPEKKCSVIMSHGDTVITLPVGFDVVGTTRSVEFAAVINDKNKLYGVQFHPEADHTQYGLEILRHFAQICGEVITSRSLNPDDLINNIKQTVGGKKVIMAVSGGVDSTVAAYLIGKAVGKNLIPVYVESGLMRPNTLKRVQYIFKDLIQADLTVLQVKNRFMQALDGITDPEEKRKTIGALYIDLFDETAAKHKDVAFLGQGTIYSDVIESKGSKHASKIKSHHNVGGLPETMNLKLIEPLRNFYKDEVRELGRLAGLPEEVVSEQPFPGPGYAVHIRGEVTEKRLQQVIQADQILTEELKQADLYDKAFQSFPVMTGAFSTAVKGDERAFLEVVAIRVYESNDIMTANWMRVPHEVLAKISSRIVNEVPDVSRVVYDITSKPPATMTWE